MRRAVVDDPEDAACVAIGKLGHHLGDQPSEGLDTGRFLAAAEDLGTVHIKGGQVGPSPSAAVPQTGALRSSSVFNCVLGA